MSLDISKAKRREIRIGPKGSVCYYYIFDCVTCGKEIVSNKGYAKNHSGKCRNCSQKKRPFQAAFTQLLGNQKRCRVDVFITYEEFYELCLIPTCHYCGIKINRSLKRGEKGYRGYFIDRMDNNKPYVKSNCVPCCWECNQAKGDRYSYQQYKSICRLFGRPKQNNINEINETEDRNIFLLDNDLKED